MARLKIAVLFGGVSSEHNISLMSAYSVLTNIPKDKYEVICIGITKKGHWMYFPGEYEEIKDGTWENNSDCCTAVISPDAITHGIILIGANDTFYTRRIDAVFPVLHGRCGEDGTVQGLCAMAGIPCVGCDMTSSAACMDKSITHMMLEQAGIRTAEFCLINRSAMGNFEETCAEIEDKLKEYPLFVKPACGGSSVGVSKVSDRASLKKGIKIASAHGDKIVVERAVNGKEAECAVLGNGGNILASVVGRITPAEEFYDFDAKYKLGTSVLTIPADIPKEQSELIRKTAEKAYMVMGCSGMARIDFFAEDDGRIVLNEINTIPGFTEISMYPKLMAKMGIPFGELIDRLITLAIEHSGDN